MDLNEQKFPEAFLNWAGSKQGGVRNPFKKLSGRPAGYRIETSLSNRLNQWVQEVVLDYSESTPTAIILVGGPGNGKTDAVEGCIEDFDAKLQANGYLSKKFEDQYNVAEGSLPPRKVTVDFSMFSKKSLNYLPTIELVQDATEKDPEQPTLKPEQLLINELLDIINGNYKGLYICCVNRGILANASSLAHESGIEDLVSLLNTLVKASSGGPSAPDCWPLNGEKLAVWPMDAESLVSTTSSNEVSVMHQILERALDVNKWSEKCENYKVCPYCQNLELLRHKGAIDNLVSLLRNFELSSGKRWTFRDLYSLVSFLFIGDQEERIIDKTLYSPCDWTSKQLEFIASNSDDLQKARAPLLLINRLYMHRLFSLWPRFTRGLHKEAKDLVLKKSTFSSEAKLAEQFFRALAAMPKDSSSAIKKILIEDFSEHLDPGLVSGDIVFFEKQTKLGKESVTANAIDERFSMSIKDGLEIVQTRLSASEKDLLRILSQVDSFLIEHNHSPILTKQIRLLQGTVRQFASRLVKRSLGVRLGICKDVKEFSEYSNYHENPKISKAAVSQIRSLINTEGYFSVPLSTTFGQPVAHRDRNISLLVSEIKPKPLKRENNTKRPLEHLPFILIHKNHFIPLTFSLFRSLKDIKNGLNEASLPEEIFAMLDEVKSVMAGAIVRDQDYLDQNVDLKIGTQIIEIETDDELAFGELK